MEHPLPYPANEPDSVSYTHLKPDNEAVYYAIDAIQTAIHKQRAISFQYFEYTPKKEKVLKHKGWKKQKAQYLERQRLKAERQAAEAEAARHIF